VAGRQRARLCPRGRALAFVVKDCFISCTSHTGYTSHPRLLLLYAARLCFLGQQVSGNSDGLPSATLGSGDIVGGSFLHDHLRNPRKRRHDRAIPLLRPRPVAASSPHRLFARTIPQPRRSFRQIPALPHLHRCPQDHRCNAASHRGRALQSRQDCGAAAGGSLFLLSSSVPFETIASHFRDMIPEGSARFPTAGPCIRGFAVATGAVVRLPCPANAAYSCRRGDVRMMYSPVRGRGSPCLATRWVARMRLSPI